MSRPKTEATIQRERDRSIRKERGEQRRQEREAKRKVRLEKQRVRESVAANGVSKVQPSESRFGLREAMEHSPLVICDRCRRIVREREFIGGLCESCHYSNEGRTNDGMTETEQGDKAVPGKGDGGSGTMALVGPL